MHDLDASDAFTRVFCRKTRRGRIALISREHYLRDDLEPALTFTNETDHFFIPHTSVLNHYLELLELPQMTDMIFLKTSTDEIQQNASRSYNRIRTIVKDARRRSHLFSNEHFRPTYVTRDKEETLKERNDRAILKACTWLAEYTKKEKQSERPIVLICEENPLPFPPSTTSQLIVCTLREYLQKFHRKDEAMMNLYESLSLVAAQSTTSQKASGSTEGALYEPHLPEDVVDAGIKSGIFMRGTLKTSHYNSDEAAVRIDARFSAVVGGYKDIIVMTSRDRNRTIPGDTVAVQLFPEQKWKEIHGKKQPTGKVVALLSRRDRTYVCTVQIEKDTSEEQMSKQERLLVIPMDHSIPKMRIRSRQTSTFLHSRILVRMDDWDIDSVYPSGHYVEHIGEIGRLDTEVSAVLAENAISFTPFAPKMLENIPPSDPPNKRWELSEEECKNRRDLRKERIFSIDPKGSQDIDDALSIKRLSNGNLQVGVHIADVTYFVPKGSLLDVEASSRSTTVYLSDRKFDMLPTSLSEDIASLRGKVDRPAVSAIWELDENCKVVNVWFGRTAIRSIHEMYYEQAQRLLEGKPTKEDLQQLPDAAELKREIEMLTKTARKLRQERLDKGALELESAEVRFELNSKTHNPTKMITKNDQEINHVVAEFMIFANKAVAERIYNAYPSCALLRHHPLPRTGRFDELITLAAARGFTIDASTNLSLAQSLSRAVLENDTHFNKVLRSLTTSAMEEAQYISTGSHHVDEFYHYGLAADFYTHFTSPIRRYADVIVHRQLLNAVAKKENDFDDGTIGGLCDHINQKHNASKQAQRDSTELFQALYFKQHDEVHDAVIYDLRKDSMRVYINKFGIKGTIHFRDRDGNLQLPKNCFSPDTKKQRGDLQLANIEYEEDQQQLILSTNRGPLSVRLFDHVTTRIEVQESRAHLPTVQLSLVHFGSENSEKNPVQQKAAKSAQRELENAVRSREEDSRSLVQRVPQNTLKDYVTYAQPTSRDSIYELMSSMSSLSLSDSKPQTVATKEGDQVTRYWKLKKRPKPRYEGDGDSVNYNEAMTEEELIEKREEMEERLRSSMSVEQKYKQEMLKFGRKFRK
ncbi:DIS3-like exonuclease 1-like [Planoprotostelium fungivorum]|uniref:DIS3-like exonuclease 1 n=1 Tax=Planoprotostelium fungivorum TaxID=1890364 RepID=A0A2P6NWF3_9EUKA|nr:DIS3-like exonuclease 1-like [Planoprotostelium fungivorum]